MALKWHKKGYIPCIGVAEPDPIGVEFDFKYRFAIGMVLHNLGQPHPFVQPSPPLLLHICVCYIHTRYMDELEFLHPVDACVPSLGCRATLKSSRTRVLPLACTKPHTLSVYIAGLSFQMLELPPRVARLHRAASVYDRTMDNIEAHVLKHAMMARLPPFVAVC